ncbi:MAG: hypothetical protein HEP71_02805 [Roseivirga sp.]|nr:hypothetical protein [Roseivirga sp.]
MISILLSPKEKFKYLMSDALSRLLALVILSGLYLLYLSFSSGSTINAGPQFNGGLVLIVLAAIGLTISYRKVKKLQYVLSGASITTAIKGELSPAAFSVHHNQVHEVSYHYKAHDQWYPVYLMTFWHSSCKAEEPVIYSNSDHSESVLMRRLSDSLVNKINQLSIDSGQVSMA